MRCGLSGRRRKNVVTHRSSGVWSHSGRPAKAWPRANGERTVFGAGSRPIEDALFLPAASIVEIKAAIKSIPASRAIRATRWISGSTVSSRPSGNPVDVKVAAAMTAFASRQIGGQTGDVAGAAQQWAEIAGWCGLLMGRFAA